MYFSEEVAYYWNEKVKLGRIIDPLGLRGLRAHQGLFLPGFNTQTARAYYYVYLNWVSNYIYDNELDSVYYKNLEKLMVLTAALHHSDDRSILQNFYSKDFALDFLQNNESFELKDFHLKGGGDYTGYGIDRYKTPISNMYLMWEDEEKVFPPISSRLVNAFEESITFDMKLLLKNHYNKDEIKSIHDICVCSLSSNEKVKNILRKVYFGFYTKLDESCDINNQEYNDFISNKGIRLNFDLNVKFNDDDIFSNADIDRIIDLQTQQEESKMYERIVTRRATLFLLLKAVDSYNITRNRRSKILSIRNLVFYKQGMKNGNVYNIQFGQLEQIRKSWEHYFLNIYFTYCIEYLFKKIIMILTNHPFGMKINDIFSNFDFESIENHFKTNELDFENLETNINIIKDVKLNSDFNEYLILLKILDRRGTLEEDIYNIVLLLLLLKIRYNQFDQEQLNLISMTGHLFGPEQLFNKMNGCSGRDFILFLIDKIIERHVLTSLMKLKGGNTKSFLFLVENEYIELYENKFDPNPFRDYIWDNLYSLVLDVGLIELNKEQYELTEEGRLWLKKLN